MIQASADLHRQLDGLVVVPEYERRLRVLLEHARRNLPRVDEARIRRAFQVAYWAHRDDRRASGEMYISHPLEVALIAARDIRADDTTVVAALLHDTVEDTDLSLDLIRSEFGDSVATITDGVTKIGSVFESRALGHAENVRKLMLSMATDLRVILVKFADRLHNMRTLGAVPPEKQLRIAAETLDLFAPLAHRFGLHEVKTELEDLSLKYLQPDEYQAIAGGLNAKRRQREKYVERFIEPIADELRDAGFGFDIYGRPKSIFSIYSKMRRTGLPLEEIYDLFAIRIVLDSTGKQGREDCWRVYSALTALYAPIPERFRDFISLPKSNGYQSLHTTVIGPEGKPVEIQIRTAEMHEIAERGLAAHWKYKEAPVESRVVADAPAHGAPAGSTIEDTYAWVRELLDNPRSDDAGEFVREFQLQLYDREIHVFTPRGELVTLPQGATPVDFAFQIHTEVGFHCIGAKVDGKMVPLSYVLRSGEQVEILTSKRQTPNPDWTTFVVTHKAQTRIRHWNNERRRRAVAHGRELLEKKLKRARLVVDEQELNRVVARLKFPTSQQLFYEIGSGLFDPGDFVEAVRKGAKPEADALDVPPGASPAMLEVADMASLARDTAREGSRTQLVISGERHSDLAVEYAACCTPVPGDTVFGYLSKTGVVKIHRHSCRNAPHLLVRHAERVIAVEWSRQKDVQFLATLRIVGEDRVGIVSDITTVISKSLKTNIRSITVDSEDGMFRGQIALYVNDLAQLRRITSRIHRLAGIYGVYRDEQGEHADLGDDAG